MIKGIYPLGEWCACVADHSPSAYVANRHHIIPLSWDGPNDDSNTIMLCPNAHSSVHRLIDEYVRADGEPSWDVRKHFSSFIRALAAHAWDNRPENPTFTGHLA